MDKSIIVALNNYLRTNKSNLMKNKNVLDVGTSHKNLAGDYYDVTIQLFVKKGTPEVELSDISKYVIIEKQKIPIVIIEGDIEYEGGVPDYKMAPSLE